MGSASGETLRGTEGPDVIVARGGDDIVFGYGGADVICGGGGRDELQGMKGGDLLVGQADADLLAGQGGSDTIRAGAGTTNNLIGGPGDDSLVGGTGTLDIADFRSSANPVAVDLAAGTATGHGTDTLTGVEGVFGSEHDDALTGSAGADFLSGRGGNDTITGNGGGTAATPDLYEGGTGDDTLVGGTQTVDDALFWGSAAGVTVNLQTGTATGEGTDTLTAMDGVWGSKHDDDLTGDNGNNAFIPNSGNDDVNGSGGRDSLQFVLNPDDPITVDLNAGTASGEGNDTIQGIEDAYGTRAADTLRGSTAGNYLDGGAGDDALFGEIGDDVLQGGDGTDSLNGGLGADRCLNGETLESCEATTPTGASAARARPLRP